MCLRAYSANSHRNLSHRCRLWPSLLAQGSPSQPKKTMNASFEKHTCPAASTEMRPVPPERRAAAQRFYWLVAKICKRHPNLVIMRCFVVITRCCSHNYKLLSHIAASGAYLMYKYKTTSKQNSNDHPANFETEADLLWCVCFVPCWYSKQHFVEFLRGWWGRIFTLYKVMLPPMANTFFLIT